MKISTTPAPDSGFGVRPFQRKLNVSQAAEFLGLSVAFLNRLRSEGGGPLYSRLGTRCLYDVSDLEDWFASRKRSSTSDTRSEAA